MPQAPVLVAPAVAHTNAVFTLYRPLQAGTPGTPGTNNRVMLTASEGENVRSGIMVTVPVLTFRPMLASSATQLPKGAGWSYEVKWDGYRTLAIKDGPRIKLLSRNLRDATRRYPTVAREVARLRVEFVMFDGEVGRYSRLPT